MRIGQVSPYDLSQPGGVQQVVIELAQHLQADGDEVVVVGPGKPVIDPGVPVRSVGGAVGLAANDSIARIALDPRAWKRTRAALTDVDVIHLHEPFIPLVGWAALGCESQRRVATFHADPPRWVRGLYAGLRSGGRSALSGVTITATGPISAAAVPRGWGTQHIVPIAVDVDSYESEVERRHNRVAFLGRDEPRKGLSVLLEAWPQINAASPGAELEVMGSVRQTELTGVTFHGRADELTKREVLGSSQVFVAPNTRGEGFGVVVAEAMAAGCAVIASDIEAFRYVLGETGVLVPVGDVTTLAREVVRLLRDPEDARRHGERARARVRRFDWSVVAEQYRSVYVDAQ